MKIVKIYGGLGNQMFQYAFSRALEKAVGGREELRYDCSACDADATHNGLELEKVFGLELARASEDECGRLAVRPTSLVHRFRRKYLTPRSHIIDRKFSYQGELLSLVGDYYYEGYWQNEKYFRDFEPEIRKDFSFSRRLDGRNERLFEELPRPIASIHVRRGDYLKYPDLDICTEGYYRRAIEEFRKEGSAASFMVFSEDVDYCRQSLGLSEAEATFVDWNAGAASWQDMAMMSRCDAHIIANSSFSWWGAWLDPKDGKSVIAPEIWNRRQIANRDRYYRFDYGEVVPERWRRRPL
jgi:hypothetical protein